MKKIFILLLLFQVSFVLEGQDIPAAAETEEESATPVEEETQESRINGLESELDSLKETVSTESSIFKVSVGARLSLVSSTPKTDIYYDIYGFIPSLGEGVEEKKVMNRLGLFVSLNQSRIEPDEEDSLSNSKGYLVLNEQEVLSVHNTDSITIRNVSYKRAINEKFSEQLSLVLSPTIRLGEMEDEGETSVSSKFYALLHMEALYGFRNFEFNNTIIGSDTLGLHLDDYVNYNYSNPYNSTGTKVHTINTYWGIGLMYRYEKDRIGFDVRSSVGRNFVTSFANDRISISRNGENRIPANWYYYFNFSLIELNSGIRLGGEVRGEFPIAQSTYSITLSKQFGFKKLGEFIKSK